MEFTMNFEGIRNNICPVRSITPEDGHYFFGYYDLMPYSPDERRHLAAKLPFDGVLNTKDDIMEFGWIEDGKFVKLFETNCWNFQQGILAQYQFDGKKNVIFYNIFDEENNCYRTVRHDLDTNEKTMSSMACGHISRDGRYGLGINFSRIWDFRPGYGYPNIRDPFYDIPHPAGDGIFLCDFENGTTRQLMDCKELYEKFPLPGRDDLKMVVNHITFNPSATRYLFLYRNFRTPETKTPWKTALFVGDLEGNFKLLWDEMVSHYWWEDDDYMISYSRMSPDSLSTVLRTDMRTGESEIVGGKDGPFVTVPEFCGDIHCSLSPDGKYMIGDRYPDKDGYRRIIIREMATGHTETLLESYSPYPDDPKVGIPNGTKDARCDLHARFNHDGTRVSFDTICRGRREIVEIDMTKMPF